MLTTRIRPKISVKPLATTKYRAASVTPLSVTTANLREILGGLDEQPRGTTAATRRPRARRPTLQARGIPRPGTTAAIAPAACSPVCGRVTFLDSY